MIQTLDLTNQAGKVVALSNFLVDTRDNLGGLIMYLIIPPSFTDLMSDVLVEEKPTNTDFYLYGWYDQFKFAVYVDETLQDSFYLVCNAKIIKVKVIR